MSEQLNESANTTETTTAAPKVEIKDAEAVYRKNQELLEDIKKLKNLRQFDGLDFDEVQEALKTQKSLREKELIKKGDYDKAKADFTEEFNKKYSGLEQRYNLMLRENAYKDLKFEFQKHGIREDDDSAEELATYLTAKEIEPVERDGKIVWIKKDGIGDVVDLKEMLDGLRTSKAKFFKGNTAVGSSATGSNGASGNAKQIPHSQWKSMSIQDQAAFIKSGGSIAD